MDQHAIDIVKRQRAQRRSRAGRIRRLVDEARAGESDRTLPIVLAGVILFVATVFTIVLTLVELAASLA